MPNRYGSVWASSVLTVVSLTVQKLCECSETFWALYLNTCLPMEEKMGWSINALVIHPSRCQPKEHWQGCPRATLFIRSRRLFHSICLSSATCRCCQHLQRQKKAWNGWCFRNRAPPSPSDQQFCSPFYAMLSQTHKDHAQSCSYHTNPTGFLTLMPQEAEPAGGEREGNEAELFYGRCVWRGKI